MIIYMNNWMITVLSLSLSGSIFIAVLFLCKPLYRERLSKRWQYYIWLVVVIRLLMPFSLEVNFMGSLFNEISQTDITAFREAEPSNPASDKETSIMVTDIEQQNTIPDVPETQIAAPYTQTGTPEKQIDAPHSLAGVWNVIWSNKWLLWLAVAVMLFIRKITIYQSFVNYIKAGCVELSGIEDLERFGKLVEESNIRGVVGIYTNNLISSPLLIGFFRPYIVLPTLHISDSDFRYTILHELTHYKRGDMFYKWLVQLTICLHWFNPLVYVMGNEINKACEFSCDESVIKNLDYNGMRAYGDTLLNAIGIGGDYNNSLSSVTLNENKKILSERLDMIMKFKRKSKLAVAVTVVMTMLLSVGATATGAYAMPGPSLNLQVSNAHEIIGTIVSDSVVDEGTVINIRNRSNQRNISESGSFQAEDNQTLTLKLTSTVRGGSVDLFLFSPDGTEQRFTIGTTAGTTREVSLSKGVWAYNASGVFRDGGDISIVGTVKQGAPVVASVSPTLIPSPTPSPTPTPQTSLADAGFEFFSNVWLVRPNNVVVEFPAWYTEGMWDVVLAWGNSTGERLAFSPNEKRMTGVDDDSLYEYRIGLPDGERMVIKLREIAQILREHGIYTDPQIIFPGSNSGVSGNIQGGNTQPRAWNGQGTYNGGYDEHPSTLSQREAGRRAIDIMERTGNWGYGEPYFPYITNADIQKVVDIFNSKTGQNKKASDYMN